MLHISFPLRTTYEKMTVVFERQIIAYKNTGAASNTGDLCNSIEKFIHEFSKLDVAQDELTRRASLIRECCSGKFAYSTVREKALLSYVGHPRKPCRFTDSIRLLRASDPNPQFLTAIDHVRRPIEQVLESGSTRLKKHSIEAFKKWKSTCRDIQMIASGLEPDGCHFLLGIYDSGKADATEASQATRAWIQHPKMGGAHLASMKQAAESLMGWLNDQKELTAATLAPSSGKSERTDAPPSASPGKKRRGPRGRSLEVREYEKKISDDWQRAKEVGILKRDFARGLFRGEKDSENLLEQLLGRVRKAKKRSE